MAAQLPPTQPVSHELPKLSWRQRVVLRLYEFFTTLSLFHLVFAISFTILVCLMLFYFASSDFPITMTFLITFGVLLVAGVLLLQVRQLELFKTYLFKKNQGKKKTTELATDQS